MTNYFIYSYFIQNVYDSLSIERRVFLDKNKNNLNNYVQSVEPLKYYNSFDKTKKAKIRAMAKTFHTKNTALFFETMINYIKYNYYNNDPEIISCLYSFIAHYVIDTKINPYIYYKTGGFNNKNTLYFNEFKSNIEQYLIAINEKVKPKKRKIKKLKNIPKKVSEVLDFSFNETYTFDNFSNIWQQSFKEYAKAIKKTKYNKRKYNKDFLNNNKKEWFYPTNKKKKYNYSFIELYNISIKECINIINEVDKYLYNDKKIKIDKLFGNLSYLTGVSLKNKQQMKYFEKE